MALIDILNKIEDEFKNDTLRLKENQKNELNKIKEENLKKLNLKNRELDLKYRNKLIGIIKKAEEEGEKDGKEDLKNTKDRKLEKFIKSIESEIIKSEKESKKAFIKILANIKEEHGVIRTGRGQISMVKSILSKLGKSFEVKGEGDFKWGLKIVTDKTEYNYSLKKLMDIFRKEKEREISNELT